MDRLLSAVCYLLSIIKFIDYKFYIILIFKF